MSKLFRSFGFFGFLFALAMSGCGDGLMNSSPVLDPKAATLVPNPPSVEQAKVAFDSWRARRLVASKPVKGEGMDFFTEVLPEGGVRLSWQEEAKGAATVFVFYQSGEGQGRDWSVRSDMVDLSTGSWLDKSAIQPGYYGYVLFVHSLGTFWIGEAVVGEDNRLWWNEGEECRYFPSFTLTEAVLKSGSFDIRIKTNGFDLSNDAIVELYVKFDYKNSWWRDIRSTSRRVLVVSVVSDSVTTINLGLSKYDFKEGEKVCLAVWPFGEIPWDHDSSVTFEMVSSGHQAVVYFKCTLYKVFWYYFGR